MFWESLDPACRDKIRAAGVSRSYPAGSRLFSEGEPATAAIVILAGELKVCTTTLRGVDVLIELRGAGELVGEMGALDGRPRSASAEAIDDITAIAIPADRYRDLLAGDAALSYAVLQSVGQRLQQSIDRQRDTADGRVVGRLARRLVERAERREAEPDGSIVLHPYLSQVDWARWLGVSRPAVVKALATMRAEGLVETARRQIVVKDLDGLREASVRDDDSGHYS